MNSLTRNSVNLICFLAFIFSLNFFRELSSPALLIFLLSSLFNFRKNTTLKDLTSPLLIYFVIISISVFYSSDLLFALKRTSQSLGLIFIPFGIVVSKVNFVNKKVLIFKTFILSALSSLIINLIVASIGFINSGRTYHFFYHHFSEFQHPSYFALSLNLAMLLSSYLYFKQNKIHSKYNHLFAFLPFVFLGGILLSSSKTGIITASLTCMIHIYLFIKSKNNRLLSYLVFISSILLLSSLFITKNPIQERFKGMVDSLQGKEDKFSKSTSIRLLVWGSGLDLISSSPFLGYGIGDANNELVNHYEGSEKLKRKYNAHNQYIQTTLETGLIGLISLLIILFQPLFRSRSIFIVTVTIIFLINLLTESILLKQIGINIFTMTYTLLWSFSRTQKEDLQKEAEFQQH